MSGPQFVKERKDEMTLKWIHRLRITLWKGLWAHTGGYVFSIAWDKVSSQSTEEQVNKGLPHSGGLGDRLACSVCHAETFEQDWKDSSVGQELPRGSQF